MRYKNLIFDLYGTLVDIHTEESREVWEKTAVFFGFYGAHYTAESLREAFQQELKRREAKAGESYECFPDIPFEQVMSCLFQQKGITDGADSLGVQAAQLFRISSLEYIHLYPGVPEALARLRKAGCKLWLLSNAQRVFTAYELRLLGLGEQLDGIYLSSDRGFRKPDARFYQALLREQGLKPQDCLMIGNDLETDIAGAKALGMATLYMHTALTPPRQRKANPACHPAVVAENCIHWEYEGDDWHTLVELVLSLVERS